jgi:Na+/proline symporter|tara:strand:+ start:994 stop:2358 length:1365 start_codon:yes stop_codon:yes gene_type:complete
MLSGVEAYQWILVLLFGVLLFVSSPLAKNKEIFFRAASAKGKTPGFWLLTSSLVISWIFAKSITNAANLGLSFGMVGGVAYAAYYLSFLVAGFVIYYMRTKGGFESIHQFLRSKFGSNAIRIFSALIAFRMFNEVWSNTMVIGTYFGEKGESMYYIAILVFTGITLAYALKGGLRSSLITDTIQMVLFGVLLFVILGMVLPESEATVSEYVSSGEWSLAGGVDLLVVALLQVLSYPFHDPVMTDRGFIASPKLTLKSFFWASLIGIVCIVLFSWIGIYTQFKGLEGQATVEVSKSMGVGMMLLMNFIMITSASSTLDSAFASFSKLVAVDLNFGKTVSISLSKGRWAMVALTILGTVPIFLGPEILSATTISGTMVIGLAPVFLFWKMKVPKSSFFLSVLGGITIGLAYTLGLFPEIVSIGTGKYAALLGANLYGTLLCFGLYFLPTLFNHVKS